MQLTLSLLMISIFSLQSITMLQVQCFSVVTFKESMELHCSWKKQNTLMIDITQVCREGHECNLFGAPSVPV